MYPRRYMTGFALMRRKPFKRNIINSVYARAEPLCVTDYVYKVGKVCVEKQPLSIQQYVMNLKSILLSTVRLT